MREMIIAAVLICFCMTSLAAVAAGPGKEFKEESELLYSTMGDASFYLVRVVRKRVEDEGYYYYGRSPLRMKDKKADETLVSYAQTIYDNETHFILYAWGRIKGDPKTIAGRFENHSAGKVWPVVFKQIHESRLAKFICANSESGAKFSGIPAFKRWADELKNEAEKWQPLIEHLNPDRFRNRFGPRRGANLDLYSVFTGVSAIRETLQTDVTMVGPRQQIDRFCLANQRTIQGAFEMYNMDNSKMMEKLDLVILHEKRYLASIPVCRSGRNYYLNDKGMVRCPVHGDSENPVPDDELNGVAPLMVKVEELEGPKAPSHDWKKMIRNPQLKMPEAYRLLPADCVFVHFPSYNVFRKSFDFFDEWASAFGAAFGGDSGKSDFDLEKKIKDQLLLKTDLLTRLFADMALSDIVFVAEDPFVFEGTAFAVILKIENEAMLKQKLSMTAGEYCKANPQIVESQETMAGRQIQKFASPDFRFSSYRLIAKGYQIICNSPALMKKIIGVIDGSVRAMTDNLDLHFFYEKADESLPGKERVFTFLSDAFIRKLIGPSYKIGAKRRLECVRNILLQNYEVLVNGKPDENMKCGDDSVYEYADNEIKCSKHRSFGYLKPISENPPMEVFADEADGYRSFVFNYNQYFTQFFDPIGFAFTTEPSFRGRLLIMPLVEKGVYSELQGNIATEALKPGPGLKNEVGKVGSRLKIDVINIPFSAASNEVREEKNRLVRRWFRGGIWIHLADHPLLFQWDSNLLARSVLEVIGAGRNSGFAFMLPQVFSIFSPIMFSLEMTDEKYFPEIVELLQREIEENRQQTPSFFAPELKLEKLVETGEEIMVLSFDMFGIRKTYYLTTHSGYLVVASKKELIAQLTPPDADETARFNGNFNLVIYPQNIRQMRSDLLEIRARSQRDACADNLRNLHFISSFKPGETEKYYQLLFNSMPICPGGGKYSFEYPVSCSVHGTISQGTVRAIPDFMKGVKRISVQSFINDDGFQSEISFEPEK